MLNGQVGDNYCYFSLWCNWLLLKLSYIIHFCWIIIVNFGNFRDSHHLTILFLCCQMMIGANTSEKYKNKLFMKVFYFYVLLLLWFNAKIDESKNFYMCTIWKKLFVSSNKTSDMSYSLVSTYLEIFMYINKN